MDLLLDTHVLLWLLLQDERLSRSTVDAIVDRSNTIFVSAVSGIEITTKVRIGKLPHAAGMARDLTNLCSDFDFREVGVTMAHAVAAGTLPGTHRDPFDRILAAQALIEGISLVTDDAAFASFGTQVFWRS
jgi:PIN domain nuclease of toxin-antitoxin system